MNFAYPPYILFLPLPLIFLNYDWSQAIWMATNLLLLLCMGLFFFPRAPKWIPLTLLLFYPIYFTLIIGNTALLIGLLLIVTINILFFKKEANSHIDLILGMLLAFTTGKPQMVWFFILLIFFYCITKKRWQLIYGFGINFMLINIVSFAIYPSWLIHWVQNTLSYSKEGGIAPTFVWYLLAVFSESQAYLVYAIVFLLSLPVSIYLFWRWKGGKFDTLSLITYVAFITNLFDPSSLTPDKIVLLIPLFLWTIKNPSSKVGKIIWFMGILLSNAAFIIGKTTPFPLAVDMLPLLFFSLWMIYIIPQNIKHHPITFQPDN
ncbi:MAG: DUF2029 domain-containing protein [Anaerolineaceae bacterium]|nr:DUF2029 domain-containing protein [Anaerolineaceae bacterium]